MVAALVMSVKLANTAIAGSTRGSGVSDTALLRPPCCCQGPCLPPNLPIRVGTEELAVADLGCKLAPHRVALPRHCPLGLVAPDWMSE